MHFFSYIATLQYKTNPPKEPFILISTSFATKKSILIYAASLRLIQNGTLVYIILQWIPPNQDQFLQLKKSRLSENPLYPKLFIYCYVVNSFPI